MNSFDDKERIRQAVDIVDLVSDYRTVHREGRNFKALCPWHDDSRPSLTINQEKQIYHCFVCATGGDIFSFVMKMEGIGFREAMEMLADRAGIKLQSPRAPAGGSSPNAPSAVDEKRRLYQVAQWAEQLYHNCLLHDPQAELARQYLYQRGVTSESIGRFCLGYAPNRWDWLLQQAQEADFPANLLEKAGLIIPRQSGPGSYDRFRDRVLFSIRDPQGRPVALGGRVLPGSGDSGGAKYINSPETPLFNKSEILYGMDLARETIRKTGTVLVMEGYTDVIAAHQAGITNAVAVLGTALGERHIRRILRGLAQRVVLVLDGDEAGRRRTEEILVLFVAAGLDLRILTLPEDLDPCDFLHRHGATEFQRLVDEAVDALEHKFRVETSNLEPNAGIHQVSQAVEKILATLSKAPRPTDGPERLREDHMLQRLVQLSGVREDRLRQRLSELRRPQPQRGPVEAPAEPKVAEPEVPRRQRLAEAELLEALIAQPELLDSVRERLPIERFELREHRLLYWTMCRLASDGIVASVERLILEMDEPEHKSLVVQLDHLAKARNRPDRTAELEQLITVLEESWHRKLESPAPNTEGGDDGLSRLLAIANRRRNRLGISGPTDG